MQYRLVMAIPLIPVGIAFLLSFTLNDTPRWLMSKDRSEDALQALSRLRGAKAEDLGQEYEEIQVHIREKEHALAETPIWALVKEVATTPSYRERFLLGGKLDRLFFQRRGTSLQALTCHLTVAMQTIAQWSGGNGITYYIPEIFKYAGVVGQNTSLITSGAYGIVKLVFTMIFTWGLVDVFGRRPCFTVGLFLQCITHIYMAVYMSIFSDGSNKSASDAAIASVFVYAVGWSVGLCTVQMLIGTEIYPTRIRNVCYATNMAIHWFFQFAVVRVTPNMFVSLHVWGAYVFWACVCGAGLVLLWLWVPETKGVPMERMEELFAGRWFMGWRAKVDLTTTDPVVLEKRVSYERGTSCNVERA